jgi:hypothetical protein
MRRGRFSVFVPSVCQTPGCFPESYGAAPTLRDENKASGAAQFLWTIWTFSIQGAPRRTICCTIARARPKDLLSAREGTGFVLQIQPIRCRQQILRSAPDFIATESPRGASL